ncbi:HAD family hydrolase [Actinomycetes bacterium KLBMP 9797]
MNRDRSPLSGAPASTPPRALLIDLDDTILDGGHVARAIEGTCEAVASTFAGFDTGQLRQAYVEAWTAYRSKVEILCWLGRVDGASVLRDTWRHTLRRCGRADDVPVEFAVQTYRHIARSTYRLFSDVRGLFATTARLRIPVALVTNGPSDVQRDKLRVLDIEHALDAVLVSGEVGVAKPDPALFAVALERIGVESHAAWHVGDGLTNDVGGARAAGLVAVWLNRLSRRTPVDNRRPDLEVASLTELSELLTELARPPQL